MTFRGCFSLFSKITQIFSGSLIRLLMRKTKLDETYIAYLKSALEFNSFDVAIDIKIAFFREPGRSLLQFVTTNCLILSLTHLIRAFRAGAKQRHTAHATSINKRQNKCRNQNHNFCVLFS